MRSLLLRLLPISIILGAALVGFGIPRFESLTSHSAQVQKAHASGPQTPAGKWNLLVTFTNTGQQEPSTLQFNSNSYFPSVGGVISYAPYFWQWFLVYDRCAAFYL